MASHQLLAASGRAALWLTIPLIIILVLAALPQGGHVTSHMIDHMIIMNLLAPACAGFWHRSSAPASSRPHLLTATCLQLAIFLTWHSPAAMAWSMDSMLLQSMMSAVLLASSVWFWSCILRSLSQGRLESVGALLITGKLVCLVAALLLFAPRLIYGTPLLHGHTAPLNDQHFAAILMLAVCPLTYVGTSIYVVARWFGKLSRGCKNDGLRT